jgi:hypothetical protein
MPNVTGASLETNVQHQARQAERKAPDAASKPSEHREPGESIKDSLDLSDPRVENEAGKEKKWTILHFGAGDNNLKKYIFDDTNEMEKVGSTENMHVISMLDQGGDNCKIHYLQADDDKKAINSPVIKDMGNTDTADPEVLRDFITTMAEEFPSENLAVIVGDHGSGWKGAITDDSKKPDGTGKTHMTLPQIGQAVDGVKEDLDKKINIFGFDCCLMATGEVGYEMKDSVKFLVASQEVEGGVGWTYDPLLDPTKSHLPPMEEPENKPYQLVSSDFLNLVNETSENNRLTISDEDFARKIIEKAKHDQKSTPTLSAMDLEKMGEYKEATNELAEAIINTTTPNQVFRDIASQAQKIEDTREATSEAIKAVTCEAIRDAVSEEAETTADSHTPNEVFKNIASKTQKFRHANLKDHYHFAQLISESDEVKDDAVKDAARKLMNVIKGNDSDSGLILKNQNSSRYPNAYGVSIEVPTGKSGSPKEYQEVRLSQDTKWDEAVNKFMKNE